MAKAKIRAAKKHSENVGEAKGSWSKRDMEVYGLYIELSDLVWLDNMCFVYLCVCDLHLPLPYWGTNPHSHVDSQL